MSPRDSRLVHFVETNIRVPSRATLRVGFALTYCVMHESDIHPTMLQTTVAVNGTVRMVPRDLKRYRSSHMPQKLRLALGRVLGCLTAFTLTSVTVSGGWVRRSVMSSRPSQGANTSPPPLPENARRDCPCHRRRHGSTCTFTLHGRCEADPSSPFLASSP